MDDSDDDNCFYGTPLEELDEDDARRTKAPRIEDQVVCDQQGRRRFHGAFTGGFSAGYFNSVGTKEGWAPSTFVSSRSQRMDSKFAKPQDFMDDEDLAAHGISPQGIQTTSSYDDSENRKRKRVIDPNGPIPGVPVLEEILKPNKETMGMKLLRKLGWKPGQGIGPRVKLSQKRSAQKDTKKIYTAQKHTKKIYGCGLPQDIVDESEDDDMDDGACDPSLTFAPDDVETMYLTTPKSDQFGLGYKPLDRTPVLGGHINLFDPSPLAMTEKKKKLLIKGQAFGVGAFEEEDEDIYATEDMSNYDFGEEKTSKKTTQQQAKSHMDLMGLVEMLEGFALCCQRHHDPKVYPKPTLPKDFLPHHKSRKRRFELKDSEKQGLGRHELTSEHRARIIAERPSTTVEFRSGVKGPAKEQPKSTAQKSMDTSEVDKIYEEFKNSDEKLRSDFKPFGKNEEKQRRYDLYLRMKDKGQKDRYYLAQPKTMTEWEKTREIHEFEKAAKLFRPLTTTMASRFVTAVIEDSGTGLKDGLNVDVPKHEEQSSSSEIDALGHNIADDRVKAAKMNMFGKLTQTVVDWHPERLLCRRFNIPSPYPESNFVGVRQSKRDKLSIFSFLEAPPERYENRKEESVRDSSSSAGQQDESQDEDAEEKPETYGLKVPVDGPPTMDLFKAIFQDSDSENEEEKESQEKESESGSKERRSLSNSSLGREASVKEERESSESETEDRHSNLGIKNSVDSFLSDMRRGKRESAESVEEPSTTGSQQRRRVSRFEPTKDASSSTKDASSSTKDASSSTKDASSSTKDASSSRKDASSNAFESTSMPRVIFMPRKKPQPPAEAIPAKGIFANIDFDVLNSYRSVDPNGKHDEKEDDPDIVEILPDIVEVPVVKKENHRRASSDSSIDSEDEYGPPIPVHLKNRQQMIKSPPSSMSQLTPSRKPNPDGDSQWVVRDEKRKSHKKHKREDKSKRKKDKKKKKHKERKHKRKSSKKTPKKEREQQFFRFIGRLKKCT